VKNVIISKNFIEELMGPNYPRLIVNIIFIGALISLLVNGESMPETYLVMLASYIMLRWVTSQN